MSREQALRVAARRKAARQRRTGRIRRTIAVVAVAAFIGPFGVIYTQLASGRDPVLSHSKTVASTASAKRAATAAAAASLDEGTDAVTSTSSGTTSGSTASSDSTQTAATPSPVTTQQS